MPWTNLKLTPSGQSATEKECVLHAPFIQNSGKHKLTYSDRKQRGMIWGRGTGSNRRYGFQRKLLRVMGMFIILIMVMICSVHMPKLIKLYMYVYI